MLALLISQAGALAHFYSHISSGQQDPAGLAGSSQACGECLSFAPLVAGGATSEFVFFWDEAVVEHQAPAKLDSFVAIYCHHAFRSRAPPYRLAIV